MELKGRKVVDVEVDGVDRRDYPDFCDAYFSNGYFADTGEQLTDDELDSLQFAYSDVLHEMAMEQMF